MIKCSKCGDVTVKKEYYIASGYKDPNVRKEKLKCTCTCGYDWIQEVLDNS